jgi:C4-dicarboxylate-binding protein DctP
MKIKDFFCMVLSFVCVMLFSAGISFAEKKVTLRLCTTTTPGTAIEMTADRFKELVEKRSNGRIEIVRYGAGELYQDIELFEAVSGGSVEMGCLSGPRTGMRSRISEFISGMLGLGLWDGVEHYRRFLDMPEVREILADEMREKYNAKLLAPWAYGMGCLASRVPIHTVADFSGLRIRTLGSGEATVFKALGAMPNEMSSSEIYLALQRGIIDAANSGPARWLNGKYYEVAPYIVDIYHLPENIHICVMNMERWNELAPGDQKILQETATEMAIFCRGVVDNERKEAFDALRKKKEVKEVYFFSEEDGKEVREKLQPAMTEYVMKTLGNEMGSKLIKLLESAR